MIGWHYTSWENVRSIEMVGLLAAPPPPTMVVDDANASRLRGVWLWTEEPVGESRAGIILDRVARFGHPVVAVLQVEYEPSDIVTRPEGRWRSSTEYAWTTHRGRFDHEYGTGWTYHEAEPFTFVTARSREKVRLVERVDVVERLQ